MLSGYRSQRNMAVPMTFVSSTSKCLLVSNFDTATEKENPNKRANNARMEPSMELMPSCICPGYLSSCLFLYRYPNQLHQIITTKKTAKSRYVGNSKNELI